MQGLIPQNTNLCIATWNVRSISENRKTDDFKKVFKQLAARNVDVACLQETRLRDTGRYQGKKYTLYWSGRSKDRRLNGVGIAVKNTLLDDFEIVGTKEELTTDRMMHGRLKTFGGHINIINVYGPQDKYKTRIKSDFFDKLRLLITNISESEQIYLAGDFNGHVGKDKERWPQCLGKHGVGVENRNGTKLLEFCSAHQLFVTNTSFTGKDNEQMTFYSSTHKKFYQIDLVLTRIRDIDCVIQTRSHRTPKKISDHFLVVSKVKIPSNLHGEAESFFNSRVRFISFMLCKYQIIDYMLPSVLKRSWEKVKIHLKIESNSYVPLILLIQKCLKEVQKLITSYKKSCKSYQNKKLSEATLRSLRAKKKKVRSCLWKNADILCKNDVKSEKTKTKIDHVIDKLLKHYQSEDNTYDKIPVLKWKTITEYSKEFAKFDLKQSSESCHLNISQSTLQLFTEIDKSFLKECILRGCIPKEILYTGIISFEDKSQVCQNKDSLKQMNVLKEINDIFTCFFIELLQKVRDQIPNIANHGIFAFRSSKSMIFTMKLLQEEITCNKQPLYIASVDLNLILDTICKNKLIHFLLKLGCPIKLARLVSHFLGNTRCTIVKSEKGIFRLLDEKEQDSLLAPILTDMFFAYIMIEAFRDIDPIKVQRNEGQVNLATVRGFCFGNSLFIFSKSRGELQLCLDYLEGSLMRFGLTIESPSIKTQMKKRKCQNVKIMVQNVESTDSKIVFKNMLIPIKDCIILNDIILEKDTTLQFKKNKKKLKKCKLYNLRLLARSNVATQLRMHYYKCHILRKLLSGLEFRIPTQEELKKLDKSQNLYLGQILKHKEDEDNINIKDAFKTESIFNMETSFRYLRMKRLLCSDVPEAIKKLIYWNINNFSKEKNYSQTLYWKEILEDLRKLKVEPIKYPRKKELLKDLFIQDDGMHCALNDLLKRYTQCK